MFTHYLQIFHEYLLGVRADPKCLKPPKGDNADKTMIGDRYIGSVVTYVCDTCHHQLSGDVNMTCVDDGDGVAEWDGEEMECISKYKYRKLI